MVKTTFEHVIGGKTVTLTRATYDCVADIEVSDSARVVQIEFHPTKGRPARKAWFTFNATPPRILDGGRVAVRLELCFTQAPKKAAVFVGVILQDDVIPLYESREKALASR